jgi:CRP-like cAMP-binding protein
VNLPRELTLVEPGRSAGSAYFLEDGICSIVVDLVNGVTVEVGIIGRDGFVGMSAALGAGQSPNRCFMQVPGYGYRVNAKTLIELSDAFPRLRLRLLQSVQALITQTAQTAACNRVHELHQRLARWLLMCHDRLQTEQIAITQEFLANMLGTRRSSVSVAAGVFQKAGIITYVRGRVNILNRDGLVNAACKCYKIVHNESVRLGLL